MRALSKELNLEVQSSSSSAWNTMRMALSACRTWPAQQLKRPRGIVN
jgi:hypothetical protein